MNQLVIIAVGGAFGAIVRFLVSTGIYQWLGRGFPYGTLIVNVVGSFLMGLLAEALISQRVTISLDYRAAVLVGFMGAFTTFSTFSLETFYLLEQGQFTKAALNVAVSVGSCLIAVWLGLVLARTLAQLPSDFIPYNMLIINTIGALLIGIIAALLLEKIELSLQHRVTLLVFIVGAYLLFSGLYLLFLLIEKSVNFNAQTNFILVLFLSNALISSGAIFLGKQIVFLFCEKNA